MPEKAPPCPFEILMTLESQILTHAKGLPLREAPGRFWAGIGFLLQDYKFVIPLTKVCEVLRLPKLTPIPKSKPWVLGVANFRGDLLVVNDLGHFVGLKASVMDCESRLFVVPSKRGLSGLVVNQILGLQRFLVGTQSGCQLPPDHCLRAYVQEEVILKNQSWPILDVHTLSLDERFLNIEQNMDLESS